MKYIILVLYIFFILVVALKVIHRYKKITSDENYKQEEFRKKVSFLLLEIFLGTVIIIFFGTFIIDSFSEESFLNYKNILKIVEISLIITGLFSYLFSKFKLKKSKLDFYIEKYIFVYVVPFLFLIIFLQKI